MKNARWVRLADDLTRGITNGDYPLDSYLPTEMELCEKYNVSRYTVRLALADLTRMGLIKRWPRLGSKVVSVGFDETYAHTYTSFADIDGLSSTHKRVVQGTQECVVDHALAKRLECERYLHFLRFSNVRTNPTDNGKAGCLDGGLCERRLLPSAGFGSVKSVGSSFHTDRERIRRKVS